MLTYLALPPPPSYHDLGFDCEDVELGVAGNAEWHSEWNPDPKREGDVEHSEEEKNEEQ